MDARRGRCNTGFQSRSVYGFRPGISDTVPGIRATLAARRGSQGVVRRDTSADFIKTRDLLLSAEIYGNTLMAEPYLPGQEITISVFADGTSLPIAERFAQKDGVAPYNGDVPVTQNSRTVIEKAAGSYNYYM